MEKFDITLDATQLSYEGYLVVNLGSTDDSYNYFPNVGGAWTQNTQAYTVALEPATYTFMVASASTDTFNFKVTSHGTIEIDESTTTYLTVEGGTKLIVRGFEVKVDARYITGEVAWDGEQPPKAGQYAKQIVYETFRMIPMHGYGFQMQGNLDFRVDLDTNGLWQYEKSYDYTTVGFLKDEATGFLQGLGTSTLTLLGYPLLIDARNAGGTGVSFDPPDAYGGFATTGVMYANILPLAEFRLNFGYGPNPAADFLMNLAGVITPKTELPYTFSVDKFHGVTRLTVNKLSFTTDKPVLETEHITSVPVHAELVSK